MAGGYDLGGFSRCLSVSKPSGYRSLAMSLCFSSIETHYGPADWFIAVLMRDTAGLVLRDGGQPFRA